MEIEITIKNYRCFADSCPAKIVLGEGLTAFLGANNAGKSTLLKFFYEFRHLFQTLATDREAALQALRGQPRAFNYPSSVRDQEGPFHRSNNRSMSVNIRLVPAQAGEPTELRVEVPRQSNTFICTAIMGSSQLQPAQVNEFNGDVLAAAGGLGGDFSRFFEAFRHMGSTRYIGSARNLINAGSNAQYFDIPVGQSFIENWRREQTGDSIRSRDAIYTLTDDVKRIFGYSGLQITASHDETTFQLVVEGRSYSLTELGSGLAQFILTFGAVAGKEQDYILIDEPELNLHPSLQLDFLTSMAAYAKKGVLFATHSYGLARSSANLIYSVQRRQLHLASSEVRPIEGMPRLSEFLGELGYAGYRELGFDKVLLVEGQSELTTIQQLLRILRKDHQVVLLPLGGSASINANAAGQLEEIKRICDNISALIDSERQSADAPLDGNRQGFVDACKEAKIPCHVLNRRAFENYFPEHAIRAEKGSKFRALLPYEKLGDASPAWGKNENWRIARRMVDADLGGNDNDLGAFLKSL